MATTDRRCACSGRLYAVVLYISQNYEVMGMHATPEARSIGLCSKNEDGRPLAMGLEGRLGCGAAAVRHEAYHRYAPKSSRIRHCIQGTAPTGHHAGAHGQGPSESSGEQAAVVLLI